MLLKALLKICSIHISNSITIKGLVPKCHQPLIYHIDLMVTALDWYKRVCLFCT